MENKKFDKNNMILYYKVKYVSDHYWNKQKQQYVQGYCTAYIVSGLEEYCKINTTYKKEDFGVIADNEKEALKKLIKGLNGLGLHGMLKRIM